MQLVLAWVKNNIKNTFTSSRKKEFGTNTKDFEIVNYQAHPHIKGVVAV